MKNVILIIALMAFIASAYGLNQARKQLTTALKAKLLDVQSSPQYILGLGIIFAALLLIQYIPLPYKASFILWLILASILTIAMLIVFYQHLKRLNFPKNYLKTVILYSFIMTTLTIFFILVFIFY